MNLMKWFQRWGWLVWIGLISAIVGTALYFCLHQAFYEIEEKGLKSIIIGTWEGKGERADTIQKQTPKSIKGGYVKAILITRCGCIREVEVHSAMQYIVIPLESDTLYTCENIVEPSSINIHRRTFRLEVHTYNESYAIYKEIKD